MFDILKSLLVSVLQQPWFGQVFAAGLTATFAVCAVVVTQYWTGAREERNLIKREKRDAYVGALEAYLACKSRKSEYELWQATSANHRSVLENAVEKHDQLLQSPASDQKVLAELEQVIGEGKELRKQDNTKLQDLAVAHVNAFRTLTYWVARLEVACSPDGATAMRRLVTAIRSDDPVAEPAAHARFLHVAKQDIRTHRYLKPQLPAILPSEVAFLAEIVQEAR